MHLLKAQSLNEIEFLVKYFDFFICYPMDRTTYELLNALYPRSDKTIRKLPYTMKLRCYAKVRNDAPKRIFVYETETE